MSEDKKEVPSKSGQTPPPPPPTWENVTKSQAPTKDEKRAR